MKARRFNGSQRAALYLAAGGRCSSCGVELQPGWHADHVTAYALGGDTDVVNGQALCPTCNLRKGVNTMTDLRGWQVQALEALAAWTPTGDTGFLVEATPGAGKTRFAIEAARRLLKAARIERIVIAVPTARLEEQWSEEFGRVGITVSPTWHAKDGALPADEQGCAATYQEIIHAPQSYRKLISDRSTLVILDEAHHCGDEKEWGKAIREACEPAVLKLLLSGTPFRSDNNEIPFVSYIEGTGTPDFRYGYRDALADGVVRAVFFPRRGGKAEWTYGSKTYSHTFDDQLSKTDANRRLRTAISPSGDWLPGVLAESNQQLTELRDDDRTAAGIVFCEDKNAVHAVAGILQSLGQQPVVATSEERESRERIGAFRDSTDRWLVSIRQVSEGVDIPRLRVGVYATNFLTPMFFRQVIGRLVRVRPDEEDPTSYLYIPDDERLRDMAENIKTARDHVLNQQQQQPSQMGFDELGGSTPFLFTPVAASLEDRGTIVDSDTISPEQLAEAERIKRLKPEYSAIPSAVVAGILRDAGHFTQSATPPHQPAAEAQTKVDRKKSLRSANNTVARRLGMQTGTEHSHINAGLNRAVGASKLAQCTEQQLTHRLELANQWLETGLPPGGVS